MRPRPNFSIKDMQMALIKRTGNPIAPMHFQQLASAMSGMMRSNIMQKDTTMEQVDAIQQ